MEEKIHNYKVTFKETYMPEEVTRECTVRSKEEVIKIYGLTEPEIEYFEIVELD